MTVEQRGITRVCAQTALLLLQYGAESAVIVQMTQRLGIALGVDSVECVLTPNAVIITTLLNENCITTARKNIDKGINMHIVTEVQRLIIIAEHKIYSFDQVKQKLSQIQAKKYPTYLVTTMVALSCSCFAHLSGGDIIIFSITFIASFFAMIIRQQLTQKHYNPIITFASTAFIATLISGIALKYQLGNDPQIAIASSVLLLVPGFPLINSLADILKGHVNMGLGRWTIATILTFGACLGIIFALDILNISNWG